MKMDVSPGMQKVMELYETMTRLSYQEDPDSAYLEKTENGTRIVLEYQHQQPDGDDSDG